jgi:hypothetical protein
MFFLLLSYLVRMILLTSFCDLTRVYQYFVFLDLFFSLIFFYFSLLRLDS